MGEVDFGSGSVKARLAVLTAATQRFVSPIVADSVLRHALGTVGASAGANGSPDVGVLARYDTRPAGDNS